MAESKEELSVLNTYLERVLTIVWKMVRRPFAHVPLERLYLYGSLVVLGVSTLFWAFFGARLQLHNADQLSDPYMFSGTQTFHAAFFPATHTFLIKWPIFWLVSLFGVTSSTLTTATVVVVALTVAALAVLLHKIEQRPVILGTLYLGLAFVMLLIPTQPYPGGILPVNMAMLTTRNLEYVFYIAGIALCVRARRIRSVWFMSSVIVLALLIASDKLFIGLSLGGAGLALLAYALLNKWRMVSFAARWLVASLVAAVLAEVILSTLTRLHVTHLVSNGGVSPYAVSANAKSVTLGVGYGILGLLTNFGANPAYGNRTLADLPRDMLHGLLSMSGVLHVVAIALVLVAVAGVWYVLRLSANRVENQGDESAAATELSAALIWSTIAAAGVFVATNHYYAVDARYLTIGFFAVAVALATAFRSFTPTRPKRMMFIGVLLGLGVALGIFTAYNTIQQQQAAFDEVSSRNAVIAQLLKRHPVNVVVGDYWRVLPIKLATRGRINVMPMASCTEPSPVLTSKTWQPDLTHHSFAYLVTLDGSLTGYPHCTLSQISGVYGRPNAIQIVAGTVAAPKEALLFYDQGSHPPIATLSDPVAPALRPSHLDELTKTTCEQPTTMNIVAHQDDDILFLNPDLLHELQAGNCVRTVYMTAGDSGFGKFYWLSRQLGSEAAYSKMLRVRNVWDQVTLELANSEYATIATPRDNQHVSLVFLNLPDGGLHGDGFPDSGHQSLTKLQAGNITHMRSVDGQSDYTSTQLIKALTTLMKACHPAEVHTQATDSSAHFPDHSDHIATSWFASKAAEQYDQEYFGGTVAIPVTHYMGYPVRDNQANVTGDDLTAKRDAFFAYAHYDGGVCDSVERCAHVPTYDSYLTRQYIQP